MRPPGWPGDGVEPGPYAGGMRPRRPHPTHGVGTLDVEWDDALWAGADQADGEMVDVVLLDWDDAEVDSDYVLLLHEIALEALALRASAPGDPHPASDHDLALSTGAEDTEPPRPAWVRVRDRIGTRRVVRWAAIATLVIAAALVAAVVDAHRTADRLAALRVSPAVLDPVSSAVTEQWRAPVTSPTIESVPTGDRDGDQHVLPDGSTTVWRAGEGYVTRADGTRVALRGAPLVPLVTDGSRPAVLVVVAPEERWLRAMDLETGRTVWSRYDPEAGQARATVQVDGVLLLDQGAETIAVDVRTGDLRWRAPTEPGVATTALTDGALVLLPERDDAGPRLAARRVADGTVRWHAPLPEGTVGLSVADHTLIARTPGEVIGLG